MKSFRPLAGITVFRTRWPRAPAGWLIPVSVPWRGLRSFGPTALAVEETAIFEFPSPGGDYGLSDREGKTSNSRGTLSFRPLAGITVFRTCGGG